jgi:hypothetical protein
MPEITPSRFMVNAGWDDAPHLSESTKRELLASTPPFLRDARAKGIPSLGAGAIYPVPDEDVICEPFVIPAWWPRAFALDVGWNNTAALWATWDPTDWTQYWYAEHKRGETSPIIHAEAIKARGTWIRGVIDPAARGRSQDDGRQLLAQYQALGLDLTIADNGVESGIYGVWSLMETGRLKIWSTLRATLAERRLYRRDEKGHIVKKNDHLMDCGRYLTASGRSVARVQPVQRFGDGPTILDPRAGY